MDGRKLSPMCLFLLACGTAAPPVSPAPAPVSDAEAPTVPGPSAGREEPPAKSASVETAYDTNPCEGTDLDLGSLSAQSLCHLERTAAPLPDGLVAHLATESLSMVEGSKSELRLVLSNTTEAPMQLELDASCWFLNVLELAIYRKGTRLDRIGSECDANAKTDCSGQVVGVKLAPKGEAFIRIGVSAQVALLAPERPERQVCAEYAGRGLSVGQYTVKLRTAFAKEPFTAALMVSPLERLPRKQCRSYAAEVAKVAEPDESLRKGVAKSLTADCLRKQPAKEFADCQLAAKTAEQLEACGKAE